VGPKHWSQHGFHCNMAGSGISCARLAQQLQLSRHWKNFAFSHYFMFLNQNRRFQTTRDSETNCLQQNIFLEVKYRFAGLPQNMAGSARGHYKKTNGGDELKGACDPRFAINVPWTLSASFLGTLTTAEHFITSLPRKPPLPPQLWREGISHRFDLGQVRWQTTERHDKWRTHTFVCPHVLKTTIVAEPCVFALLVTAQHILSEECLALACCFFVCFNWMNINNDFDRNIWDTFNTLHSFHF